MSDYLKLIDVNTPGPRCDVTPLFANATAFAALIADLARPFETQAFEFVAGIDALGFVLGAALARHLNKGFIALRKGGKLPVTVAARHFTDYTGLQKSLEIRTDLLRPGDRVLLTDEWIETGAQASAAIALLEDQGAKIIGIATINIDDNPGANILQARYFCHALWQNGTATGL